MNNVNIHGYSERGVMNALFYGIAYEQVEKKQRAAIQAIINAESINETKTNYQKFDFYMEFSLSEFGSPDLIIIVTDDKGQKTAFFVEAKVSNGHCYDINKEYEKFDDYLKNKNNDKNNASNLFFQLGLKKCYSKIKKSALEVEQCYSQFEECFKEDEFNRLIKINKEKYRKLGGNLVVNNLDNIINAYDSFKFLAIIPKQQEPLKENKFFSDVKFLYWEDLYKNQYLSRYLKDVIDLNGEKNKSLIFNPK